MILGSLRNGDAVLLEAVPGSAPVGAVRLLELGFEADLDALIQGEVLTLRRHELDGWEPRFAVTAEELGPPLQRPPKIVAIGLNYREHASESKMETPAHPLVFSKFTSSIVGPFDDIVLVPEVSREVDFEVELAVVIGRTASRVERSEALEHVFGYTIVNDVSARDLQFADQQWVRAKSLDTFCPLGPVIVTADAVPDPQRLRIGCDLNGERMQDASTGDMIFGVAELISTLSRSFTLLPGDVIASGTPSGVGFARVPPVYLQRGDELKAFVEGLGSLTNRVRESEVGDGAHG